MRPPPNSKTGAVTRRGFFSTFVDGLHGAALASLLAKDAVASEGSGAFDLRPRKPHFPAKASAVIHLFMNGGPSQVDLFDPKPLLSKYAGTVPTRDLSAEVSSPHEAGGVLPSPYKFERCGKSGIEISEVLPHLKSCADDIAVVRSMYGEHFNHVPALFLIQSGRIVANRPTLGAWVAYGLGTENQNLPAYVVLDDPKGLPVNGIENWQSGYLPAICQGTRFRSEGTAVLNLNPPSDQPSALVEAQRRLIRRMDEAHRAQRPLETQLDGRIASYELAARMQLEAGSALDLSQESDQTRDMYGLNDPATASYGRRCLMARRLVERGVRFVQLYIEAQIWDAHSDLDKSLRYSSGKTDKPVAALLKDLKQRGLMDSTLVVWGGEFGRLPLSQSPQTASSAGRDHGPSGFSIWVAGAGVKGGTVYGATDDFGHKAVGNPVSVHDYHATILHLLGMNYRDLAYERHGLKERLTDQTPARVVQEILS